MKFGNQLMWTITSLGLEMSEIKTSEDSRIDNSELVNSIIQAEMEIEFHKEQLDVWNEQLEILMLEFARTDGEI